MKELLFKCVGHVDQINLTEVFVTVFKNEDLDDPKKLVVPHILFKNQFLEGSWFDWYQYEEDGEITTEIVIQLSKPYTKEELKEFKKEIEELIKELPDEF